MKMMLGRVAGISVIQGAVGHPRRMILRPSKQPTRNRLCRAAGGAPLRGSAEGAAGVGQFLTGLPV